MAVDCPFAQTRADAATTRGRCPFQAHLPILEHLRALRGLRQVNLAGVIVGKALYEGRFTIAEAQAALDGKASPTTRTGGGSPGSRPAP